RPPATRRAVGIGESAANSLHAFRAGLLPPHESVLRRHDFQGGRTGAPRRHARCGVTNAPGRNPDLDVARTLLEDSGGCAFNEAFGSAAALSRLSRHFD